MLLGLERGIDELEGSEEEQREQQCANAEDYRDSVAENIDIGQR